MMAFIVSFKMLLKCLSQLIDVQFIHKKTSKFTITRAKSWDCPFHEFMFDLKFQVTILNLNIDTPVSLIRVEIAGRLQL